MSVWPQGTTYAPYHIAHNPSACRERERENNEYARTAAGDDELYLRYADNLPEYGAYGSCFSHSSVFHNVLCMFVAS